jgi:spore coat protein A, manganese oxidase
MEGRPMLTRRQLLAAGVFAGTGLVLPRPVRPRRAFAAIAGGSLDPGLITKYAMPLVIPPAMPRTAMVTQRGRGSVDYYEIAVRQFSQQILPSSLPATTVWSYGSASMPGTFNDPAFTIEANFNRPVRVKWINDLKDSTGRFRPHLLAVDPTLHWANPPGGTEGRDMRPTFASTPGPYRGPVPIVTHLHGGHNAQESDGFAEAWFLPTAADIPAGFASEGTFYEPFRAEFLEKWGVEWEPGTATFQYENDQRAGTFWYHDHTLGMTRLNVYAGPAGFYLLRRGPGDLPPAVIPGPAPGVGADPFGRFYEIPLAIQDRSFNVDGSLFYPASREFFDGFAGPFVPASDVPSIWNPEFFGNTIVVNGRTWPFLRVEPRRYRLRILNGCNARFLILKVVSDPLAVRPATPVLPFWQIGAEGGFLPRPVRREDLLIAPAERADVIVDFTGVPDGISLFLINEGPDEPFGRGSPGTDFPAADPGTTGQVMRFDLVPLASKDTSQDPARLTLPAFRPLGPASLTQRVSLNEADSAVLPGVGPTAALLGTLGDAGPSVLGWDDPITENPALGATEIWELHNFTEDAHPIHIHEVQFQVVDRQPIDGGAPRAPEPWETGLKDTVIAYPDEITRVRARFDLPGLYVWHCHIVEHEDNEMIRPYFIGPNPPAI